MDLATSSCFGSHVRATDNLTLLIKASVYIDYTVEPFYMPGINSLFIMSIGIIRNNSLVDGRARTESNPGHWARHALLHMTAECVNHSATKAGCRRYLPSCKTSSKSDNWFRFCACAITRIKLITRLFYFIFFYFIFFGYLKSSTANRYKRTQLWNRLPNNLTNNSASQSYRNKLKLVLKCDPMWKRNHGVCILDLS